MTQKWAAEYCLLRALVRKRPLGLKNDVLYWYLFDREPPAYGFVAGELLIELPTVWSSDLHIVASSDAVLDLPSHSYLLAIKVHIPNLSRWDVVRTWVYLTQGSHPMRHLTSLRFKARTGCSVLRGGVATSRPSPRAPSLHRQATLHL